MSAAKAKGTRAESGVVAYLQENGFRDAERRALRGINDAGDVAGLDETVIEVKDHADRQRLGEWMAELIVEMNAACAEVGGVWHKRRGKGSPADWYVTMPGWVFIRLLRDRRRRKFLEEIDET